MEKSNLTFALYQPHHYPGLKALMQLCFADLEVSYSTEKDVNLLAELYPRGQIVCLLDGKVVGANISRIVPYATYCMPHTQANCIDMDRYQPDMLQGDSVYGLDVFVHPDHQNLKIGKQIVEILVRHTFEDNFRCMMGICRVVNYPNHMHEMDCATYAQKVKAKELYDPCLSFHIRNGMEFVNVSPNFSPDDHASAGYGVIMAIYNPDYDPALPTYPERARFVREMCVA